MKSQSAVESEAGVKKLRACSKLRGQDGRAKGGKCNQGFCRQQESGEKNVNQGEKKKPQDKGRNKRVAENGDESCVGRKITRQKNLKMGQ